MRAEKRGFQRGFTLLELIVVVSVVVVLALVVVVILNPAEMLARGRDTRRLSDLAAIKIALHTYITEVPTAALGELPTNNCRDASIGLDVPEVMVSTASNGGVNQGPITDPSVGTAGVFATSTPWNQVTTANFGKNDGTGWIPANITTIPGTVPLSNYPVDPVNRTAVPANTAGCGGIASTLASPPGVNECAQMYVYVCNQTTKQFELNANLESAKYRNGGGASDKESTDGGNNANVYEVGTLLTLLGAY